MQQRPDTASESEIIQLLDIDNVEIQRDLLVDIVAQYGKSPLFKIKFISNQADVIVQNTIPENIIVKGSDQVINSSVS